MPDRILKRRRITEEEWIVPGAANGVEALSPEEHEDRHVYADHDEEEDDDEVEPHERGVSGPPVLLGDEDYE